MLRRPRTATGGTVYHVLNRGVARVMIFDEPGDYQAFETVLTETHARFRCRVLNYCLMHNHCPRPSAIDQSMRPLGRPRKNKKT